MDNIILGFTIVTIIITLIATWKSLKNIWNRYEVKKDFIYMFLATFLLIFMGYGCMVASNHYSVDSFNLLFDMIPEWHLSLGRYTNTGIIILAEKAGVNQVVSQRFFMGIWIVALTAMIIMIAESFAKFMENVDKKKFCFILMAVSLSFLNVFGMELMLFPEMAMVFMLGNLTLGLSIRVVLSDMQIWKKWILTVFFLMISIGNYQSYIGIFEAFSLFGLFIKWKSKPVNRYKESIGALFVGGFISILNVIIVKVVVALGLVADSNRGAALSFQVILNNIQNLIKYQWTFWTTGDGLLGNWIMPLLAIGVIGILSVIIRELEKVEQKIYLLVMLVVCYVLGFAPHLVEANQALTPRSNIAIWSVIAAVFITGIDCKIWERRKSNLKIAVYGLLGGLIVFNIYIMQDMAANEQAINAVDLQEAKEVANEIWKYESETGNLITKIAMGYDSQPVSRGMNTRYVDDQLGKRIMATGYSSKSLISYAIGRQLLPADMSEEIYQEYFEEKNWNCMAADEQVVCVEDTAYVIVY